MFALSDTNCQPTILPTVPGLVGTGGVKIVGAGTGGVKIVGAGTGGVTIVGAGTGAATGTAQLVLMLRASCTSLPLLPSLSGL